MTNKTVAEILYESYPDSDLLPIDPPRPGETIDEFADRAEHAGDTLFLFLCRDLARLTRAIGDIEAVRDALQATQDAS